MRHGTRPTPPKHTDYDFIKSHRLAGVIPHFADEFFADAGLTMPNQDIEDTEFTPPTPAMPFGCTNFTHADLATDLTGQIHNPNDIEAITHANARGGLDIRVSLDACTTPTIFHPERLGWFKQYFNCRRSGQLDWFDTFRLAQVVGLAAGEKRSITLGTPWFPLWEQAILSGQTIMPMPTNDEMTTIRQNPEAFPWHDSKLDGWTKRGGAYLYRDKSWQGTGIGEKGFIFFPREVINAVMEIWGTVGFTGTYSSAVAPLPVDLPTLQRIASILRSIIQRYIPSLAGYIPYGATIMSAVRLDFLKKLLMAFSEYLNSLQQAKDASQMPQEAPIAPLPQDSTPTAPQPPKASLEAFMTAMRDFEGAPGDLNYQNNNPLNCRCSPVGYASMYGTVLCVQTKSGPFAKFAMYQMGWMYAKNLIKERIAKYPHWTIFNFIADPHEGWSPASDGNPINTYAEFIGKHLNVDPYTFTIDRLV